MRHTFGGSALAGRSDGRAYSADPVTGTGAEPAPADASTEEAPALAPSGPPSTPASAQGPVDDEDDDADLLEAASDVTPNADPATRVKQLANALRKAKKRAAKQATVTRELETKAQGFDRLSQTIASNATLRKALGLDPEVPEPAPPAKEEEFDESALPFDPKENPVNAYFANLAKQNHELARTLRDLQSRLDGVQRSWTQRQEAERQGQWDRVTQAAIAQIPSKALQTILRDQMIAAYGEVARMGFKDRQGRPITAERIVGHYLQQFEAEGLTRKQVAQATAAATRMAQSNQSLPRPAALSGGSPAPARDRSKERIGDVVARVVGRRVV